MSLTGGGNDFNNITLTGDEPDDEDIVCNTLTTNSITTNTIVTNSINNVSSTTLGYLDATSSIQTQLTTLQNKTSLQSVSSNITSFSGTGILVNDIGVSGIAYKNGTQSSAFNNEYLTRSFATTLFGAGTATTPRGSMGRATNLTTVATTLTVLPFDTVNVTLVGMSYNSSNNRITFTEAGSYYVELAYNIFSTANTNTFNIWVAIRENGTVLTQSTSSQTVPPQTYNSSVSSATIEVVANEFIDFVYQQSGGTNLRFDTTGTGTLNKQAYSFSIFRVQTGKDGTNGANGTNGTNGAAATIAVGITTTLSAGSSATVTNSGSSSAATFNFGIPQGIQGIQGVQGQSGLNCDLTIGTTTTLSAGSSATATNSGTVNNVILNLGIPQGVQGVQGQKGDKGDKGDSTVAAEIAAAASAASAAASHASAITSTISAGNSATSAAQAAASVASVNTQFEGRVAALEDKTDAQYRYTDINVASHTQFEHFLEVLDGTLAPTIIFDGEQETLSTGDIVIDGANNQITVDSISIDGNNQLINIGASQTLDGVKLITPTIEVNNIDARTIAEDINIGSNSQQNINLGNPFTQGISVLETTINFYGLVNFGSATVVGTPLFQF